MLEEDLVGVLIVDQQKAREEQAENCSRMPKDHASVNLLILDIFIACTWSTSRFICSKDFALIPPAVILARQSKRRTICMSAPCAIISSIAVICPVTSYEARRSLANGVNRFTNLLISLDLLCCISSDLLNNSVRVNGTSISERPVSECGCEFTHEIFGQQRLTKP